MATKKMTLKYWSSLEKGSRKRALQHVFPTSSGTVDIMLEEKPTKDDPLWKIVFKVVRIPDGTSYKTVVNETYIA